jgi:hypothetical protein
LRNQTNTKKKRKCNKKRKEKIENSERDKRVWEVMQSEILLHHHPVYLHLERKKKWIWGRGRVAARFTSREKAELTSKENVFLSWRLNYVIHILVLRS